MIHIKGKVSHQDLEMGFWGIVADDGSQYMPQNLSSEFQKDGLKVEIKAKEVSGMGIFMWGTPIEIIECKKA